MPFSGSALHHPIQTFKSVFLGIDGVSIDFGNARGEYKSIGRDLFNKGKIIGETARVFFQIQRIVKLGGIYENTDNQNRIFL